MLFILLLGFGFELLNNAEPEFTFWGNKEDLRFETSE